MGRIWQRIEAGWLLQRGALFPWVPVLLACGIGLYFGLPLEPPAMLLLACGGGAAGLMLAAGRGREWTGPLLWAVALLLAGVALAGLRAHLVAAPVLAWRSYGPVEGRIVGIDRSATDALRLTLDRVVLARTDPDRVPHRVRIALQGDSGSFRAMPGNRVMMTAHLGPPGGPVEPGGFDFQRQAWFLGIGAVGYTQSPVLSIAPAEGGQPLLRARMALSSHVQSRLPGQVGAFAAAIMTGDRSGLDQTTLAAMRVSNLAHLLAISGLHMGLLAGFVFAASRLGFAAVPRIGLRWPAKKLSAALALAAAAGYLALSGGNVATERAFVMVAVMLTAVMLDRRALTLRAVALAATIVLCLTPEALLGPGFQMSFAATVALVAVFGGLRDAEVRLGPPWLRPVLTIVISSAVAGAATAPVAAAHFNQISQFGLLANLLSVPLMGVLVMPAAVLSVLGLPFGLDGIALWVMGLGLDWILMVAERVRAIEGARIPVVSPGPEVLPMLALGALFVVLWQGWLRLVGILPALTAFWFWAAVERPLVLISESGRLVGVMTETGRALNKSRGDGFVAANWLENDGDGATREAAHARWSELDAAGLPVRVINGRMARDRPVTCLDAQIIVLTADPVPPPSALSCRVINREHLRASGAVAIWQREDGLHLVTARDLTGQRLWNRQ